MQEMPSGGQICNWCHLVAKSGIGAIWWPNLQLMLLVPPSGQICNQYKWRHLVARFVTNAGATILWSNLEPMKVAPPGGKICNLCNWWHSARDIFCCRLNTLGACCVVHLALFYTTWLVDLVSHWLFREHILCITSLTAKPNLLKIIMIFGVFPLKSRYKGSLWWVLNTSPPARPVDYLCGEHKTHLTWIQF